VLFLKIKQIQIFLYFASAKLELNVRKGTVCKANLKLRELSFQKSESSTELETEALSLEMTKLIKQICQKARNANFS